MRVPSPAGGQVLGAALAGGPVDVPLGAAARATEHDVGAPRVARRWTQL